MKLAERMSRIGVESAFDVLVRARALEATGKNVIHLEIGEPDFPTPGHVVSAAKQALDEGWTHYGPTQGLPDLREAIAAHISRTRGINVGPQHVSVVPGGKPIIFFPMLALLEPGDEVIYPNPGFPIYESMIRFSGATPVPLPLEEARGFSFDLNRFESLLTPRTKMVVLNSPQNPTGGIIPREDLAVIANLLRDRDVIVLSDEIYSEICYDEAPSSITQFPGMLEKTIILDGFSKTYAMTGWRMGYGVMPTWLVEAVNKLMVNSNSCTASFTQRAGIAAINGPQHRSRRHGGRIPSPPRCYLRRSQPDPRIPLRHAWRRLLRLPQRHRHRHEFQGTRRLPALRNRCCRTGRRLLRRVRRRLYPLQLRQLSGEADGSRLAHPQGRRPLGRRRRPLAPLVSAPQTGV